MMKNRMMSLLVLALAAGSAQAKNWKPHFEDTYIKMAAPAAGNRCGALTIKKKPGIAHRILISSSIYSGSKKQPRTISKFMGNRLPNSAAEDYMIPIPPDGITARFDWGGRHPDTHYRIYAYKQDRVTDYPVQVPAKDVLRIENVLFNRTCGNIAAWAGGTGAKYGDLNMNKG